MCNDVLKYSRSSNLRWFMKIHQYAYVIGDGFVLDHRVIEEAEGDAFAPHIHEDWEMLFFLRGDVIYKVEGKSYRLSKGDLVLSKPSVFHNLEPSPNSLYERYNVILDGRLLPKSIRRAIPDGIDVFGFAGNARMFDLFEKMQSYSESFSGEELELIIKNLLIEVVYNLVHNDGYVTGKTSTNPLINKALAYIEEHLTTVKSIDEICEALFITKSHLHHLFSGALGVTPKQYINTKRLLLAQKHIRRGRRATEVAAEVGYEDYATFFRNYKKYFGYAPSEESTRVRADEIKA